MAAENVSCSPFERCRLDRPSVDEFPSAVHKFAPARRQNCGGARHLTEPGKPFGQVAGNAAVALDNGRPFLKGIVQGLGENASLRWPVGGRKAVLNGLGGVLMRY